MKILLAKSHGILDYLTVIIFLLAPSIVGFSGLPATISYLLAIVHFLLTLFTSFQMGVAKIVPLAAHGIIELIVSIVLIILPWILGFADNNPAKYFFIIIGIIIFLVWLTTNYKHSHKV